MAVVAAPPRVQLLLARHGLDKVPARCVAIGDGEVWRVGPLVDRRGDACWRALRIWPADGLDLDAVQTRIAWLDALGAEGLTVPAPLRDRDGQVLMHGVDAAQGTVAMLQHWVPGRIVYAGLRPVHLRRIGELLARFHASAQRLAAAGGVTSAAVNGIPIEQWAAGRLPASAVGTPRLRAAVVRACTALHTRMAGWPRDAAHWGYLHGDLHPWNLVHHRGGVGAIDFGDSGWGWWAQEFASVLQWLHQPLPGWHDHTGAYPALRDALMEGYASLRPLPPGTLAWMDDLLLLRSLATLRWMLEDWPRADHRPWGPAFLRSLQRSLEG